MKWGVFELSEYLAAAKEFAIRKLHEVAASEKRVAKPSELFNMYVEALVEDPRVPKPLPQWLLNEIRKAIQKTYREHSKELKVDILLQRAWGGDAEEALMGVEVEDVGAAEELVEEEENEE